jgi:integrase/recombinase XerD
MAREGVPLNVIQRQLGHAHLGVTSIYLQGIDNSEIINTVHARPAPVLPASTGLRQPSSSIVVVRSIFVAICI